MPMDESVRKSRSRCGASLRAIRHFLCGNVDRADDLVQETLRVLCQHRFLSAGYQHVRLAVHDFAQSLPLEYRKRRREVEDGDGHHAESPKSQPDQYGHVEFREFREALH